MGTRVLATFVGAALCAFTVGDGVLQLVDVLEPARAGDDVPGYVEHVRSQLTLTWTDAQLVDTGQRACDVLGDTDGDLVATIRSFRGDFLASRDLDVARRFANDIVFIVPTAIVWLCPQWKDEIGQELRA